MIEIVKFKAEHIQMLREQDATAYLTAYITPEHEKQLETCTHAYTGIVNGRVVTCAGVIEYWHDRGEAWAIMDRTFGQDFLPIHRAVKRFLDLVPYRRIEAVVDYEFVNGHRWVKMLGFRVEAERMKAYLPRGRDATLYARIR